MWRVVVSIKRQLADSASTLMACVYMLTGNDSNHFIEQLKQKQLTNI